VTNVADRAAVVELDVVGVGVGTALVSGALSVVAPSLAALTGTLAVLSLAGWGLLSRQHPAGLRGTGAFRSATALGLLGLGAALFVDPPGPWSAFRGLALGLSLVPLWAVARRLPRGTP
jgi:hypothetical protein